jgi:predicted TIM-barrel enzyme
MRDACDHFVELADVRQQLAKAQAERDEARALAIEGAALATELDVRLKEVKAERDEARVWAVAAGLCLMNLEHGISISDGSTDHATAFLVYAQQEIDKAKMKMRNNMPVSPDGDAPKPNVPTPSERGG